MDIDRVLQLVTALQEKQALRAKIAVDLAALEDSLKQVSSADEPALGKKDTQVRTAVPEITIKNLYGGKLIWDGNQWIEQDRTPARLPEEKDLKSVEDLVRWRLEQLGDIIFSGNGAEVILADQFTVEGLSRDTVPSGYTKALTAFRHLNQQSKIMLCRRVLAARKRSSIPAKIVNFMVQHPSRSFSAPEVARGIGVAVSHTVRAELHRLQKQGKVAKAAYGLYIWRAQK